MIKNEATINEPHINDLRDAIEHRATWFYFLTKAANERGLNLDDYAREAIYNCGAFHGMVKFPEGEDLKAFHDAFATENVKKIFEWDVDLQEDELNVTFNYCPLVKAWQKLTDDEKLIDHMCDIAMDGDRGIVAKYDTFEFDLGDTIAKGCPSCKLTIRKKK